MPPNDLFELDSAPTALTTSDELFQGAKDDLRAADGSEMDKFRRYRAAGSKLNRAKEICPHTEWLGRLRSYFNWKGERQAQRYMKFAKTSPGTDLEEERMLWKQCGSHQTKKGSRSKEPKPIRNPPPDDGFRDIKFAGAAITSKLGAYLYEGAMKALRRRNPGLSDAEIWAYAVYRLWMCDKEPVDGVESRIQDSRALDDDGRVDGEDHWDVD